MTLGSPCDATRPGLISRHSACSFCLFVQRLEGTQEPLPTANSIVLIMVCHFCCLLSSSEGRLALVLIGISLLSLLDSKSRVWMLLGFSGEVLNTLRPSG